MHRKPYSKEFSGESKSVSYVGGISCAVKSIEWNAICIEPYQLLPFVMIFLNRNLLKDFCSVLVIL